MIRWASQYLGSIQPVFLDGLLYVLIAIFGAITACMSTDEAAKYLEPETLFWIRTTASVGGAAFLALKMFRSTAFADHQASGKETPK